MYHETVFIVWNTHIWIFFNAVSNLFKDHLHKFYSLRLWFKFYSLIKEAFIWHVKSTVFSRNCGEEKCIDNNYNGLRLNEIRFIYNDIHRKVLRTDM